MPRLESLIPNLYSGATRSKKNFDLRLGGCGIWASEIYFFNFVGRNYIKFRRARTRTPRKNHGRYTLVLLAKASPLAFIATRGLTEENT